MKHRSLLLLALLSAACGNGGDNTWNDGGGNDSSVDNYQPPNDSGKDAAKDGSGNKDGSGTCGTCPTGYTCGSANGLAVCRSNTTAIPLFTNVFVIMMENTTLATLLAANPTNLKTWAAAYATASNYHGVAHPSLPNYVGLTSGGTQGIPCDCAATPSLGTCNPIGDICFSACTCTVGAQHIGDQIEAASKTWMDFGEDMGASTPCNVTDSGNYAQRHNPFLYYNNVQGTPSRCNAHVVDFSNFNPASPAAFNFLVPNLIDDMHSGSTPIPTGDAWLGAHVPAILSSTAYTSGGLLVIVWDEDDGSGGLLGNTDDPIGLWVFSPYAKNSGYVSSVHANHYDLLATFEDGLALGRLSSTTSTAPLTDFFPAN